MKKHIRVLLIEDEETDAELIELAFTKAGYAPQVSLTTTAAGAEKLLLKADYDLIISDYRLPECTAKDVLKIAQKLNTRAPIIIVTGSLPDEIAVDLLKSGATDYIIKDRLSRLVPAAERALNDSEEKKKLEEARLALMESEERYRDIFETTSDFIFTVSREGLILYSNPSFNTTLGYSPEETARKTLFDFTHPECGSNLVEEFKKAAACIKVENIDTSFITKAGKEITLAGSLYPKCKDGKLLYLQGIFRNVTEHKELERRLFQSQKMEAIGRLAGGIAHDFNNILGAIEGYATLILNTLAPNDAIRPDIEEIRKAEQRAAALTKQLLLFSRKHAVQKKAVNMNSVITELQKMATRIIGEDIKLEIHSDPALKIIQADQPQLEQVLMNLIVNARDAMPDGGKITIATSNTTISGADNKAPEPKSAGNSFIRICVSDTGCGMNRELLSHLFEPFFTTKPKGKGTGLGLPTVYGIVKQHNGWVEVKSEPFKGTDFSIYLPEASHSEPAGKTKTLSPSELRGNGEKVLVVEDDEDLRKLTCRMLKENGYTPVEAKSAAEAMEIFAQKGSPNVFKIIFSDMILSDKKGTELIESFKHAAPSVLFVFTSGYVDDKSNWEYIVSQGHRFIQKPYSIDTVLKTFKDLLHP